LHGEIDASLLAAGAIGFDRLNEAKPLSRSLSLTKRAPYDALVMGALGCHLAINRSLGLLLRNTGGDLGFLRIETAKADRAIGPCWPSRNVSQFTCAIARPSGLAATSAAPPRNKKPNCHVRFKSQPPCSVIRRGLARRVGSTEPAARRTTRRQPRSHRPDVRP